MEHLSPLAFDPALFVTYLAACAAAAATGALFQPGAWYDSLRKPVWTPPRLAFPLVWTILYLGMALAAMRVAMLPGTGMALALWSAQIAFNTLWTPIFFGLKRMRAALVVMGGLWLSVALTALAFWQIDTLAGIAFGAYLSWVSVAAALNAAVLRLNPSAGAVAP